MATVWILSLGWWLTAPYALGAEDSKLESLRRSLTFHAGFDGGTDANFALGDGRLHTTLSGNTVDGEVGLKRDDVMVIRGGGRYGDALRFEKKVQPLVYYQAKGNVYYRAKNWSGTVSIWLSLDPDKDLEPGYCDPLMITDSKWNDAAIWFDFTKENTPRQFRLGVFSDKNVWNPDGRKFDDIPIAERPIISVEKPPFGRGKWTHVVATFSRLNSDGRAAIVTFYLNGEIQGRRKGREVLSWKRDRATIRLGWNYIGLMDDIALFNRALSQEEVRTLYQLPKGAASLAEKKT